MLREYAFLWRSLFIILELSISAGVFVLAYWLRFQPWVTAWLPTVDEQPLIEHYLRAVPAVYVILFFTNSYFRLYHPRRVSSFLEEFRDLFKSNIAAVLLLLTFFFFNRSHSYSRAIAVLFAVLNLVMSFVLRLCVRSVLRWLRSKGYNLRSVIIVGTGRLAQSLLHRFQKNHWTGVRVLGFVGLSPESVGKVIHGSPVIGTVDEIDKVLETYAVHQAFIALPFHRRIAIERLVEHLAEKFVAVRLVPELGFLLNNQSQTYFDGLHIINLWENHLSGWNAFAKRALDLGVALTAVLVLAPFLLAIGAWIKLTTNGPIFYVQRRMGHDGRVFSMIKFRTMQVGAEDDTRFTQRDDERCTPIGRFLRRTSLDELPQLFNVVAGQMSLVGPRPERPVFIEKFRRSYPSYMLRHKVKAGMTGWAQVNGWRGDTSLRKRLQYDLYYLHNWSLWLDVKILLMTLFRGSAHRNAY